MILDGMTKRSESVNEVVQPGFRDGGVQYCRGSGRLETTGVVLPKKTKVKR